MPGQIYGVSGTGLSGDVSFAASKTAAEVGRVAEQKMGVYLNEKARAFDVAVLHDLRNPNPRYGGANIDEVVCWADDRHVTHVQILDTKAWKPGLYWTFGGKTRRGLTRLEHLEGKRVRFKDPQTGQWVSKRSNAVTLAQDSLRTYLAGTGAVVEQPLIAVYSSRKEGKPSTGLLKYPGCRVVAAESLDRVLDFDRMRTPDSTVVARLAQLVTPPKVVKSNRRY